MLNSYLLLLLCGSVLRVMWLFLGAAFRCIEKAHEHLRESESRNNGTELVREKAA